MIPNGPRRTLLMGGVVALWLVGIAVIFGAYAFKRETVVISHWANGHMAAASLLPTFARDFNAAQHITQSGKVIEVRPFEVNSGAITCQLIRRVKPGTGSWWRMRAPTARTPTSIPTRSSSRRPPITGSGR